MSAADRWLGVHLRRLSTLAGITATRSEKEDREAKHGGSVADLNTRVAARATEVARLVRATEAHL